MSAPALMGFTNQARREAGTWWATRRWWVQGLVWTGIVNALLALQLWIVPRVVSAIGDEGMTVQGSAAQFAAMAGLITAIGVVVTSQGILLDERRVGVLEWMLSKPLSRAGLLAAKFVSHSVAILVCTVLVPWLGALAQLSLAQGELWPLGRWWGALVLVGLLAVFHLALVLALSTLTWSRPVIIAVPLVCIFGSDPLVALLPSAFHVLPWSLGSLAGAVLAEGVLVGPGPIVSAVGLTVIALVAAVGGLRRTEL